MKFKLKLIAATAFVTVISQSAFADGAYIGLNANVEMNKIVHNETSVDVITTLGGVNTHPGITFGYEFMLNEAYSLSPEVSISNARTKNAQIINNQEVIKIEVKHKINISFDLAYNFNKFSTFDFIIGAKDNVTTFDDGHGLKSDKKWKAVYGLGTTLKTNPNWDINLKFTKMSAANSKIISGADINRLKSSSYEMSIGVKYHLFSN